MRRRESASIPLFSRNENKASDHTKVPAGLNGRKPIMDGPSIEYGLAGEDCADGVADAKEIKMIKNEKYPLFDELNETPPSSFEYSLSLVSPILWMPVLSRPVSPSLSSDGSTLPVTPVVELELEGPQDCSTPMVRRPVSNSHRVSNSV